MMAGLPLILQSLEIVYGPSALWKLYYTLSLLLGTGNTVLGVCALFWLAPWFGLWVVGQGRVVFWTVLLVKGLPYVAGMAWSLTYRSLMSLVRGQGNSPWFLGFLVPEIATLLIYAWLIRAARRQLLHLGGTEPLDASQMLLRFLAQISGLVRRARSWPTA